jgi:predicted MFS family arabinose efflux permease
MSGSRTDRGSSSRYRASLTGLLAVAMGVSVLPGFCLGVLAEPVLRDLEMSRAQLGLVVAAVSGVCALSSIWLGHFADQRGGRATLLLTFGLGAATFLGIAVAPTFGLLLIAAILGGLCQGAANPGTNRVVLDSLAEGRRGLLTGVKQSGEMGAIVLAGVVLPLAAVAVGWRGTVLLVAALPAAAIVATLILLPAREAAPAINPTNSDRAPLSRDVWWLTAYTTIMGLSGGAVSTYLPLYSQQAVGVSVVTAGQVLALTGLVAIPGRILWGRQAERTGSFPGQFMILSGLGVVAAILLWAGSIFGVAFLWVGAVAWGLSQMSFGAVSTVAVMALAATHAAGRATGVVLLGFSVGLMIGPALFGWLIDLTDGYGVGFGSVVVVLVIATLLSWVWMRRPVGAVVPA